MTNPAPADDITLPAYRCIKPQCPPTCSGCSHAVPPTDTARTLVARLLTEFAVDGHGITFEDGDHPLVDEARTFLCSPPGDALAALDRMDALLDPALDLLTAGPDSATAKGSRDDMRSIRDALAACASPSRAATVALVAQAGAGGMALLPLESTGEMDNAGMDALGGDARRTDAECCWRAMAAVAFSRQPAAVDVGAAQAETAQAAAVVPLLSEHEQRAILRNPVAIACLIGHHDCEEAGADAVEPGLGSYHARRVLELLAIGRAVIAEDPEIWPEEERKEFALRYSERATPGATHGN